VKLPASALDQKLSCKSACENLDAISARSAVSLLEVMLHLSKKSLWPPLWLRMLYLHAYYLHQHMFNRIRVATLR